MYTLVFIFFGLLSSIGAQHILTEDEAETYSKYSQDSRDFGMPKLSRVKRDAIVADEVSNCL